MPDDIYNSGLSFETLIGIERNIEIELTLGRVNSPQVLAEERVEGATPRGFGLDNVFVALDFLLKYKFNVETKGISTDVSESGSFLPDTPGGHIHYD